MFSKRINRKCQFILLFVLIVSIGSYIWWLKPTLRLRTEKSFRSSILQSTPLNSSSEQVFIYIKKRWPDDHVPGVYTSSDGTKKVSVMIGSYWASFPGLPIGTYVYISWVFDENDRLIDVLVNKETDGV